MADFQNLLIHSISVFFQVIYILIFIRIVLSWFPVSRTSGIGGIIFSLTEPILGPIRHMIHKSPIGGGMMLDFSPVIALFIMQIIRTILIQLVYLL